MSKTKFRLNEYIVLKLENKTTKIYVGGQEFLICKSLFILDPYQYSEDLDINSIDDMFEKIDEIDRKIKSGELGLDSETEFWGHCSNLQVWAENDYDTNLLSSKISLPLLKRLCELGDKNAIRNYKKEIIKKFISNNLNTVVFMIENKLLEIFSLEELEVILGDFNFKNLIKTKKISLKVKLESLKYLTEKGSNIAENYYRNLILTKIRGGKVRNLEVLYNFEHLDFLDTEELIKELTNLKKKNLLQKFELEEYIESFTITKP